MADFDPNMVRAAQDAYHAAKNVEHKEGATPSEKAGDISAAVTKAIMPVICETTGLPKIFAKIAPSVARHCSGFVLLAKAYEKRQKKQSKQAATKQRSQATARKKSLSLGF
ncbi:MAG: hypothetical protein PHW76_04760 [Alphaproteobacteria bacterium]|nr:hypothetical protein [Alphaproteobacteria bacterium]